MKRRIVNYLIAALALAAMWIIVVFIPIHKQQVDIAARTDQALRQLNDYKAIMEQLPAFLRSSKNLEAKRRLLSSSLYDKEDILKLFRLLREQAQNRNLVITEISPPIEELLRLNRIIPDSSKPQFLNINLKLQGGYVDFGRFIDVVEQSGYFRGIRQCRIIGDEAGNEDLRFQLGFNALLGGLKEKV